MLHLRCVGWRDAISCMHSPNAPLQAKLVHIVQYAWPCTSVTVTRTTTRTHSSQSKRCMQQVGGPQSNFG